MKTLKVRDREVAQRLQERLLRKRKVVAIAENQEDIKRVSGKKVDVVLMVERR